MGYYIQTPMHKGKSEYIVKELGGREICQPLKFSEIPDEDALIIILDNGAFEAAGLAYDEAEFFEFTNPRDRRRKQFVLLEKEIAYREAGFMPSTKVDHDKDFERIDRRNAEVDAMMPIEEAGNADWLIYRRKAKW